MTKIFFSKSTASGLELKKAMSVSTNVRAFSSGNLGEKCIISNIQEQTRDDVSFPGLSKNNFKK